jgi:hypothetical protein
MSNVQFPLVIVNGSIPESMSPRRAGAFRLRVWCFESYRFHTIMAHVFSWDGGDQSACFRLLMAAFSRIATQ